MREGDREGREVGERRRKGGREGRERRERGKEEREGGERDEEREKHSLEIWRTNGVKEREERWQSKGSKRERGGDREEVEKIKKGRDTGLDLNNKNTRRCTMYQREAKNTSTLIASVMQQIVNDRKS